MGAAALLAIAAGGIAASSASASSHARAASKYSVVYIPGLTGNPFYSTVACGAAVEAKKLGVSFSTQGAPTFAVNAQTPVVNAVVARHPTAIMISKRRSQGDDPAAGEGAGGRHQGHQHRR
jgi:ribose transport system substrate-binding protein